MLQRSKEAEMDDIDIPGTRLKARITEYGVSLVEPGTAWTPGSSGATGNQIIGPLKAKQTAALIKFLAGCIEEQLGAGHPTLTRA
jgi:hypothetical protein